MKHLAIHISMVLAMGLGLTSVLLWLMPDGNFVTPEIDKPHYSTANISAMATLDAISVYLPMISRSYATELHVCSDGCPYASIQAAVDAGSNGDVIKVAAGTYTGVTARPGTNIDLTKVITQVVYLSKTVVIRGGYTMANWITPDPSVNPTTLDAQGQGRVVYIIGDINPTIEGLRLTGGNAAGMGAGRYNSDAGGGVYVANATAVISNNQIFSNTATDGGGLGLLLSDATLTDNAIFSNTATNTGGGLDWSGGYPTLRSNTVSSNAANSGGGLSLWFGAATLTDNVIVSNTARGGGGVLLGNSAATLTGNAIFSNTATDNAGGGLLSYFSDVTLTDNTIFSNIATGQGGGLALLWGEGSGATLTGNAISFNSADLGGGLYLFYDDSTLLVNNLVADNQARQGSAIYNYAHSTRMLHNTVAHNSDGDGSGIYVTYGQVCDLYGCQYYFSTMALTNTILVSHTVGISVTGGSTATLEATLWGTGAWANSINWSGDGMIITGTHNYWGDPAFVNPSAGDYHIGPTSAAIDKGVNAGVTIDLDGNARPDGCFPDIGAYEFMPGQDCKHVYLPLIHKNGP